MPGRKEMALELGEGTEMYGVGEECIELNLKNETVRFILPSKLSNNSDIIPGKTEGVFPA